MSRWSVVLALAAAMPIAAGDDDGGAWPPMPAGTKAVLLVTGGDAGYYRPKGCNGRDGGALYRQPFDGWLQAQAPQVQRVWLSAGDNGPFHSSEEVMDLEPLLEYFARVGYLVSGLGTFELQTPGPAVLATQPERSPVPFVATNLRVHETGLAPFATGEILDVAGARVLVLAVAPHLPTATWADLRVGTIVTIPASEAIAEELERRKGQYDRVVLLSAENETILRHVLAGQRGVDVVFASAGGMLRPQAETIGDAKVLWLGMNGRILGRAALGPNASILEVRGVRVKGEFPVDPLTGAVAP